MLVLFLIREETKEVPWYKDVNQKLIIGNVHKDLVLFSNYILRSPCIPQRDLQVGFQSHGGRQDTDPLHTLTIAEITVVLFLLVLCAVLYSIKGSELLVKILKRFEI